MKDWEHEWEVRRREREQQEKRNNARAAQARRQRELDNAKSPAELAALLHSRISLQDHQSAKDAEDLLTDQVYILDRIFTTTLHEAGLGRHHGITDEALKSALQAQRQCRQTVALLKSKKYTKQTKEKQKEQ